jgi:hypothetical protein
MTATRTLLGTGAILSLALGVAACGGGEEPPPPQPVATTQAPPSPEYWDPKAPGAPMDRGASGMDAGM